MTLLLFIKPQVCKNLRNSHCCYKEKKGQFIKELIIIEDDYKHCFSASDQGSFACSQIKISPKNSIVYILHVIYLLFSC